MLHPLVLSMQGRRRPRSNLAAEGMEERIDEHRKQQQQQQQLPFWWFGRSAGSRRSPWLMATLSELEEKTKGMLKLIEEDADSFAKRAEMYYEKRPELICMIEDLYRAHRSLAEKYDQLRLEGCLRRTSSFDSSFLNKSWSTKARAEDKLSVSSADSFDSEESEADDPEPEYEVESSLKEVPDESCDSNAIKLLNREVERLKMENAALNAELAVKDEAKREVIRQLSLSMDIMKEENNTLRKCIKDTKKSGAYFEFKKLKKGIFSGTGKLFTGLSRSQTTIVAL